MVCKPKISLGLGGQPPSSPLPPNDSMGSWGFELGRDYALYKYSYNPNFQYSGGIYW